jgi:predicted Fe-Mo cluster-binding NifX family protein
MRIVVTSSGADLDAPASPVFGRCRAYVFVDTENMDHEAVENPAIGAASGAGIRAAQFVIEQGAQAVVTGNVGPNALSVLQSAGVPIYPFGGGTVRQAAEAFRTGQLQSIIDATAQAGHSLQPGMGMGRGMGQGRRAGMGARMQPGMGTASPAYDQRAGTSTPPQAPEPEGELTRAEEITALKKTAQQLQGQLAQVMERLEQLQGET